MKKLFLLYFFIVSFVLAHTLDAELSQEIQKGKGLIEKLQRGEIKCQDLKDEDFHSIGEYAMDLMVGGDDHLRMNEIIKQMHGEEGEELMHINMGKRFSGCEGGYSMMPMMGNWMWRVSQWPGWNIFGWLFGILGFLWLLVVLSLPILVLILLILLILNLIKKLKRSE